MLQVMLSIGKLAQLAELTVSDTPVEETNLLGTSILSQAQCPSSYRAPRLP